MYITILAYLDKKRSVHGSRIGRAEVVVYQNSWKGTMTKGSAGGVNYGTVSSALGKALNKQEWLVEYMRKHYKGDDSTVFNGRYFNEGGVGVDNLIYALGNAGIGHKVKDKSVEGRTWCLLYLNDDLVNQ